MHKPLVLLMILLLVIPFSLFSDALPAYVPYEENEFPLWTYKLRRAETLFFGSLVITLPVAILLYNLAKGLDVVPESEHEMQSLIMQTTIASALSLGISITDFIIGEVEAK